MAEKFVFGEEGTNIFLKLGIERTFAGGVPKVSHSCKRNTNATINPHYSMKFAR